MKKNENIIVIFISCESLILGDSNNISIAGHILNIFLLIEANITVIGNLNNFCVLVKVRANVLKTCTC